MATAGDRPPPRPAGGGALADGVDVDLEAELLWSMFDGSGLMAGYRTKATALAMIDYHLGRLFPHFPQTTPRKSTIEP